MKRGTIKVLGVELGSVTCMARAFAPKLYPPHTPRDPAPAADLHYPTAVTLQAAFQNAAAKQLCDTL